MIDEVEVVSSPPSAGLDSVELRSVEDHVGAWKTEAREVEKRLWRLASIADSLVDQHGHSAVGQFAQQVGMARSRVYQLSKSYRLRMSMPEHAEAVGKMANGRELTTQHFYEAALSKEPQETLRSAVDEGFSAAQIRRKVKAEDTAASSLRTKKFSHGGGWNARKQDEADDEHDATVDLELVELGDNLRELRDRSGKSQAAAARSVGMPRDELAQMENGMAFPTVRQLARLCGLYETTMDMVAGHLVPVIGGTPKVSRREEAAVHASG